MTIIDKFLNFQWLAKLSTSRKPLFKGLLPSLQTMLTLLLVSLAIASGVWLWTGAIATVAAFIPVYLKTIAAISGTALLNFWFNRDITTAVLNAREVLEGQGFDEYNPVKIRKLVDQVRCELNVRFREEYGEAHVDLPMPRLCMYTFEKAKIQTVMGRTPENIALFFSSTFFDSIITRWDQRHIAALVAHQLTQAYHRRGWSSMLVSIASNFLFTLESLQTSEYWYFRALGMLAGPVQLFFFIQKAIERSYSYEAAEHVVKLGRGYDYFDAIDNKVCPSLRKQPGYSYAVFAKDLKKRKPYDGPFKNWLRPLMDRIDNSELAEDNKEGNRFISALDIAVRESIYSFQEMNSNEPRTTRLKDHLRDLFKLGRLLNEYASAEKANLNVQNFVSILVEEQVIDELGCEAFYEKMKVKASLSIEQLEALKGMHIDQLPQDTVRKMMKLLAKEEMANLDRKDRVINQKYYNAAAEELKRQDKKAYDVISPASDGKKPLFVERNQDVEIIKALLARVAALEANQQHVSTPVTHVTLETSAPTFIHQQTTPPSIVIEGIDSDNDEDHQPDDQRRTL